MIIAEPSTGLGNRLRCISSLMRIAKLSGRDFAFSWPVNQQCASPFEALFEEPKTELVREDRIENGSGSDLEMGTFVLKRGCNVRVISAKHLKHKTIHAQAAYFYLLESAPGKIESRETAIREAGEILGTFQLNSTVEEKLRKAIDTFGIEQRVGVHVRRGDVEDFRCTPISRYFEKIENNYAGAPLFVTSDDEEVLQAFERRYGNQLAIYPSRSRVRTEPVAVQDALIELLLLSRTRVILAGQSSFSEVAAMIGGTRLEVLHPHKSTSRFYRLFLRLKDLRQRV